MESEEEEDSMPSTSRGRREIKERLGEEDVRLRPSLSQPSSLDIGSIGRKKIGQKRSVGEKDAPYVVPSKTFKVEKERKIFEKRSVEEEKRILHSFKAGMDEEDAKLMKEVIEEMEREGRKPFGVDKRMEFSNYLKEYTPKELITPIRQDSLDLYYDDEELAGVIPNRSGCARTEAFHRVPLEVKLMRRLDPDVNEMDIDERGLDTTYKGNCARFINHCCDPNCFAKEMAVEGEMRMGIYSKKMIEKGDELSLDYKFPVEDDKITCFCGAIKCQGTLN